MGLFSSLFGASSSPRIGEVRGNGDYEYDIVGESQYKDHLAEIIRSASAADRKRGEIETTAIVIAEPDNKFDPKAIKVIIDNGTVGYIPKSDTAELHKIFKDSGVGGLKCPARIGWDSENIASGIIGVRLDLS